LGISPGSTAILFIMAVTRTIRNLFQEIRSYSRKNYSLTRLATAYNNALNRIHKESNSDLFRKISASIAQVADQENYTIPIDVQEIVELLTSESSTTVDIAKDADNRVNFRIIGTEFFVDAADTATGDFFFLVHRTLPTVIDEETDLNTAVPDTLFSMIEWGMKFFTDIDLTGTSNLENMFVDEIRRTQAAEKSEQGLAGRGYDLVKGRKIQRF